MDKEHLNWVVNRRDLNLSELEKLTYELNLIERDFRTKSTYQSGLQMKIDKSYMTNDGYMLGSIVWYIVCSFNDWRVTCFGRTPEQATENAIQAFKSYAELPQDEFRKWLKGFEKTLKSKADEYARYV